MSRHDKHTETFETFFRRNETTVYKIAAHFYRIGTYHYNDLVTQLVEHLWNIHRTLPPDQQILNEPRWVGVILFRYSLNHYRTHLRRQQNIPVDTSVDIDTLPDTATDDQNPYIPQLYKLLSHLDKPDLDFIYLYLDRVPLHKIAHLLQIPYHTAVRRLHAIEQKLKRLNETLPDEDL